MIRFTYIIAALCLLAGLANGIGDELQFHYEDSFAANLNPEFWNPSESWRFKYAKDAEGDLIPAPDNIYYRSFDLKYKERYPLSATALSFTTDAWHLAKFFYHAFLRLAIVILFVGGYARRNVKEWARWEYSVAYLVVFAALTAIQAAGFHVFYTLI